MLAVAGTYICVKKRQEKSSPTNKCSIKTFARTYQTQLGQEETFKVEPFYLRSRTTCSLLAGFLSVYFFIH